jgi:hypothetical protein
LQKAEGFLYALDFHFDMDSGTGHVRVDATGKVSALDTRVPPGASIVLGYHGKAWVTMEPNATFATIKRPTYDMGLHFLDIAAEDSSSETDSVDDE